MRKSLKMSSKLNHVEYFLVEVHLKNKSISKNLQMMSSSSVMMLKIIMKQQSQIKSSVLIKF